MLDNIPEMSERMVNTERVTTVDRGMAHKEGGNWIAFRGRIHRIGTILVELVHFNATHTLPQIDILFKIKFWCVF